VTKEATRCINKDSIPQIVTKTRWPGRCVLRLWYQSYRWDSRLWNAPSDAIEVLLYRLGEFSKASEATFLTCRGDGQLED